jgi:hypothetical protein
MFRTFASFVDQHVSARNTNTVGCQLQKFKTLTYLWMLVVAIAYALPLLTQL